MNPVKQLLKKIKRTRIIAHNYSHYIAWKQAKRGFRYLTEPVVLIYQMGKVGSTSVYQSIQNHMEDNNVFHIHFLSDDIKDHIQTHKQVGEKHIPFHLKLGIYLRKELNKHPEKPVKIVSLVREPLAWFISVLFEPPYFEKEILDADNSIDPALANRYIVQRLNDKDSFHYLTNWFDKEIKQVFSIDVFAESFSKESGYQIYRKNNIELLVIKLEDLDRIGSSVLRSFLELEEEFRMDKNNVRLDKKDADIYKSLINTISIDKDLCKSFYSIPFATHFYSKDQINSFIDRWSTDK